MATPARKFELPALPTSKKSSHIIQCPSCSTKFALAAETLKGSNSAKFHCSRCDNIFTTEVAMSPRMEESESSTDNDLLHRSSSSTPAPISNTSNIAAPSVFSQSELFNSESFNENSFDTRSFDSHLFDERSFTTESLEPSDAQRYDDIDFSFEESDSSIQGSGGAYGEIAVAKFDEEPMGYKTLTRSHHAPAVSDPLAPHKESLLQQVRSGVISLLAPGKGISFFIAPCAAFLLIASGVAGLSAISPRTVASAASVFGTEKVLIAPKDVFLKNTKVKRIALDSGTMVSQISGTVVNQSSLTFRELEIQGIVFDRSNKIIGDQTTKVSSNIGKSRLQSLTAEMIQDLQRTAAARNFTLKPGSEAQFTTVVVETPSVGVGAPKNFVARVYAGKVL